MKISNWSLIIVFLILSFLVLNNGSSDQVINENKKITNAVKDLSSQIVNTVKTYDIATPSAINPHKNEESSDVYLPKQSTGFYNLSDNPFNNQTNANTLTDNNFISNEPTTIIRDNPYVQEMKNNYPQLLKLDNMSGNTVGNSEHRFAETDNGYSSPAFSDLNVSQYPSFYTSDVKDELIDIGKFFNKNNQYLDNTSYKSSGSISDSCYTTKDNQEVCLENSRLQSIPSSLISDLNQCGAFNLKGQADFSEGKVMNGQNFFNGVFGSSPFNEVPDIVKSSPKVSCSL
tara:strand:- start:51 stop:911 length:861 start_codon:yes stop_codon:yes gene_type:complete